MPLFCGTSLIDCCVQDGSVLYGGLRIKSTLIVSECFFSCEGGGYYVKVMSVLWEDS